MHRGLLIQSDFTHYKSPSDRYDDNIAGGMRNLRNFHLFRYWFDVRPQGKRGQNTGAENSCQGAFCKNDETGRTEWPLSLATPPPASHNQATLRKKAARIYIVPEGEIVLREITVGFYNELNGTVRG